MFKKIKILLSTIPFLLFLWFVSRDTKSLEEMQNDSETLYPKGEISYMMYYKGITSFWLKGDTFRYVYRFNTPATSDSFYNTNPDKLFEKSKDSLFIERKGNVMKLYERGTIRYFLVNCHGKLYKDPIIPEYFQDSLLVFKK